ncbi:MAG: 6,7-dimethyl-8-ribityllumazine synthase [Pseudomonadota bacterium]
MKPILLVVAPYYQDISEMLITGATAAIYDAGYTAEMIAVPGALEIPAAISIAQRSERYAGFVALGCVIRGETSHYDTVSNESARGLQDIAIRHHTAIGNGILTCETMAQAVARADTAQGNKGGDAARACLRMVQIRHVFGLDHA